MDESKPKRGEKKEARWFSQEQYEILKRCSEKEDMTEWNEWRKNNPDQDILLERAPLQGFYLEWVYLNSGTVIDDDTGKTYEFHGEVHLENANFVGTDLRNACLIRAHLEGSQFSELFNRAHLEGARLDGAYLQGSRFNKTHLESADFRSAVVDGGTSFWDCKVNRHCASKPGTNFEGVGLDIVCIDSATKQLLEYNIRRKNWEWWYEEGCWLIRFLKKLFIKPFWWMSNYGRSVSRIVACFFGLAVLFALVYWLWPSCAMVNEVVGDIRGFWHALYFSVVTMTTLGFGDIAANPDSWWGQTLLMVQVILGYVLLGALVTRFAVLFTAGGPAGKFADEKRKPEGTRRKE